MQIGTKIWAIDPCEQADGVNPRLTVGNAYVIEGLLEGEIIIKNDFGRDHYFSMRYFDTFFSLTPPKEVKEGDCKSCGAKNAMRWDKQEVGLDDKQGTWLDLNIRYCEECGKVESYELG